MGAEFEQFDSYPWQDDEDFQAGLSQVCTNKDDEDMVLRAKCFFYAKKFGVEIDAEEYKRWKQSDKKSYNEIVELILAGKPVPGIKEIPDTVLGDEASSESMAKPRKKPWE